MKKHRLQPAIFICAFVLVLCFTTGPSAKVEWEILKDITLTEEPRDIAVAPDGATAYILCGKSVQVYSVRENKVTGNIPLTGDFSQIAVAPSGEQLFVTNTAGKQLSVIQISQVFEIPKGTSPVIGKADAPVTVYAFLDYQWPYCSRVYPVLEQLLKKYPEKVNMVIKHFPLRMHKFAEKA